MLTALVFLAGAQYDDSWVAALFVLLTGCVALTIVDPTQYRLPNHILFPALLVSAAVLVDGELVDGGSALLL